MSSSKKPDKSGERISGPPFEEVSSHADAAEKERQRAERLEELLHPSPTEAEA